MADKHSISEFIDGFNGGLRPNRFYLAIGAVTGVAPPNTTIGDTALPGQNPIQNLAAMATGKNINPEAWVYHCRAASMPPATMSTIPVPYRGRIFKMPGVRTYATWEMTVLDDRNHGGYRFFSDWSNAINGHSNNQTQGQALDMSDLMTDITVFQLSLNGDQVVKQATLQRAWCSNVGQLSFDMENNENLITFTVQLEFSEMVYEYNG
jgi:hypothetical protein